MFDKPPAVLRHEYYRQTISDDCRIIKKLADYLEEYNQRIPIEDDPAHADLYGELSDWIHSARLALDMAWRVGKS